MAPGHQRPGGRLDRRGVHAAHPPEAPRRFDPTALEALRGGRHGRGHGAMGPWGHGVFKPGIWVDIGGWFFIVSFSVFFDVNYQS